MDNPSFMAKVFHLYGRGGGNDLAFISLQSSKIIVHCTQGQQWAKNGKIVQCEMCDFILVNGYGLYE